MDMPKMEATTKPPTIADMAAACLLSSTRTVPLPARENSLLEDQFARLSSWTSSMHTFAPHRASMDHRLREAPEVQEVVIGLLEALNDQIKFCLSPSITEPLNGLDPKLTQDDPAPEMESFERAVQAISEEITLLYKLSNTIRRASKISQKTKYSSFKIEDHDGNDMELTLKHQFSQNLLDQFPAMSEKIRERLVHTILLRRKRILYLRMRYGTTAVGTTEPHSQPTVQLGPVALSQEKKLVAQSPLDGPQISQAPLQSIVQSKTRSATTLDPERFRKASSLSVASTSKTVALSNHEDLIFPPASQAHIRQRFKRLKAQRESEYQAYVAKFKSLCLSSFHIGMPADFEDSVLANAKNSLREFLEKDMKKCLKAVIEVVCPFCCYSLSSVIVNDNKKWREHVKNDLDAYVCLFEDCDEPNELYGHSEDWLRHMRQHTLRWHCKTKSHGLLMFETREEYEKHMREKHEGTFTKTQLPLLAHRNSRSPELLFESCPLCGSRRDMVKGRLEDHIIGHLRFLTLKSLPRIPDDDLDDGSAGEISGVAGPQSRSTVRNDPENEIIPVFFDEDILPADVEDWSIVPDQFDSFGGYSSYIKQYPHGISKRGENCLPVFPLPGIPPNSEDYPDSWLEDHSSKYIKPFPSLELCYIQNSREYEWGRVIPEAKSENDIDLTMEEFRNAHLRDLRPVTVELEEGNFPITSKVETLSSKNGLMSSNLKEEQMPHYKKVAVLLITWKESGVISQEKEEVDGLTALFKDELRYNLTRFSIPNINCQIALQFGIFQFLDHHTEESAEKTLFIIYYIGSSNIEHDSFFLHPTGRAATRSNVMDLDSPQIEPSINWSNIQACFGSFSVKDTLFVMDCCFAGASATNQVAGGTRELLAACGSSQTTPIGPNSFTHRFIRGFRDILKKSPVFQVAWLYEAMVTQSQGPMPLHVNLNKSPSSIWLHSLAAPPNRKHREYKLLKGENE